jgi:hypothetical protein
MKEKTGCVRARNQPDGTDLLGVVLVSCVCLTFSYCVHNLNLTPALILRVLVPCCSTQIELELNVVETEPRDPPAMILS